MSLLSAFSYIIVCTKLVGLAPKSFHCAFLTISYDFSILIVLNVMHITAKLSEWFNKRNPNDVLEGVLDIWSDVLVFIGSLYFKKVAYKTSLDILDSLSKSIRYTVHDIWRYHYTVKERIRIPLTGTLLVVAVLLVIVTALSYSMNMNSGLTVHFNLIIHTTCFLSLSLQYLLIEIWYVNMSHIIRDQFVILNAEITNVIADEIIPYHSIQYARYCCNRLRDLRKLHKMFTKMLKDVNKSYGFPIFTHFLDILFKTMFLSFMVIMCISLSLKTSSGYFEAIVYVLGIVFFVGRAFILVHTSSTACDEVSSQQSHIS